jgi:hypothetical protein
VAAEKALSPNRSANTRVQRPKVQVNLSPATKKLSATKLLLFSSLAQAKSLYDRQAVVNPFTLSNRRNSQNTLALLAPLLTKLLLAEKLSLLAP